MADAKSEKLEIKRMGAKAQKNSGRSKHAKGDAVLPPFIVDVKEAKASFALNKQVWAKICSDSAKHSSEPALMIALGEQEVVRLWIIGETMFQQMLECYREKNG